MKSTRNRRQERFLFAMMGIILVGLFISGYFLFVDRLLPALIGDDRGAGRGGAGTASGSAVVDVGLPVGPAAGESLPPGLDGGKVVALYFGRKGDDRLVREMRRVPDDNQPVRLARTLVTELLRGPQTPDARTVIPKGTQLRALFYHRGIFTIDFTDEMARSHPGGVVEEALTVYSIVNTLAELDSRAKVQILLNGREASTLRGHVALDHLLVRLDSLVVR